MVFSTILITNEPPLSFDVAKGVIETLADEAGVSLILSAKVFRGGTVGEVPDHHSNQPTCVPFKWSSHGEVLQLTQQLYAVIGHLAPCPTSEGSEGFSYYHPLPVIAGGAFRDFKNSGHIRFLSMVRETRAWCVFFLS